MLEAAAKRASDTLQSLSVHVMVKGVPAAPKNR